MDSVTITKSNLLRQPPQGAPAENLSSRTWGEWASDHKVALTACAVLAAAAVSYRAIGCVRSRMTQFASEGASLVIEPLGAKVLPTAAATFDREAVLLSMRKVQLSRAAIESGAPLAQSTRVWEPMARVPEVRVAPTVIPGARVAPAVIPEAATPHHLVLQHHPDLIVEDLALNGGVIDPRPVLFSYHPETASPAELLAHGLHGGSVMRSPRLLLKDLYVESRIPHGWRPLMDEMVHDTQIATAESTFSQHMPGIAMSEMPVLSLFKRKPSL